MQEKEMLRIERLTKIYPGGVLANYEVSFSVNQGEIHALVGGNGAGKSTLMKCLFGIEEITSGQIFLEGKEVCFSSSQDAIDHGIGMVQQNMMLVPSFTVAENLVLGMEPHKGIFIDKKKCIEDTEKISQRYNLKVDAKKRVRDISVGMKQKLEILKAMYRNAKVIILDEPTAVLAPQETEVLFQQLRKLRENGFTIIFISHKLGEVKALCDRLTVLKGGRAVGTYNVADVTEKDISRAMIGQDIAVSYEKNVGNLGEVLLRVDNLRYKDYFGAQKLKNVSFSLKTGEILGIAGIEGNGQLEILNILTGNLKADRGRVFFRGKDITGRKIRYIRDCGIAHVPEDRAYNGSAMDMSLRDNFIAPALKKFVGFMGLLNRKKIDSYCNKCVAEYQIVSHSLNAPIKSLSGGNVQKCIVAREFTNDAECIVLNQPTRGVDIGAMKFIHNKILEMRSLRKSMLLLSSDLSELQSLSDRIIVIYEGTIVGVIENVAETSEEELGLYMLGLRKDSDDKLMNI
ncbi:MAG: ABC transporter ATP-binding protein [Synergistaceae bacterium]|jgi:simple sugar transport system ATP-binding protein|nr:ABC transporter ATP-binding protein [Synergistaceae bacterium]